MKNLLFISIMLLPLGVFAQQLIPPINGFSYKKESFLVKNNGDTVRFFFLGMGYRNKLKAITSVTGKDANGKKTIYMAEDVKIVALPPSDFGKYASFSEANSTLAKSQKHNQRAYNREMVYFFSENAEGVSMFLQLLNPDFDSKIQIFHDVYARETMSWGVGGVALVGGDDKSYFIKENGKTYRIHKKDYKETFAQLFGNCPKLLQKYPDTKWTDFAAHVFFYDNECE